ncbi:MAG: GAF domain-containing protein, partial [Methylococcaceae bacterium]|nr:GAF domain-containing protein [Methylococcaceae bacterium]
MKHEKMLSTYADALGMLDATSRNICEVLGNGDSGGINSACSGLLKACLDLFHSEVCAIFLIRNDEAVLEAQLGYDHLGGFPIPFDNLQQNLRYKIGLLDNGNYDGITGLVASTGKEFSANTREEIKRHPSHVGKPDRLKIWGDTRPFRCVFAVPLKIADRSIGVLKVENKRGSDSPDSTLEDRIFDETDKKLL